MPPDPPSWRASRVWEPDQSKMTSAGPVLKLPSLQKRSLFSISGFRGITFFARVI